MLFISRIKGNDSLGTPSSEAEWGVVRVNDGTPLLRLRRGTKYNHLKKRI